MAQVCSQETFNMTTPLDVICAMERYAQAEISIGISSREDVVASQLPAMIGRIKALPSILMDDATAASNHRSTMHEFLNPDQTKEVANVIKSIANSSGVADVTNANGTHTQRHDWVHFYLTAMLWGAMCSMDHYKNKFKLLATFLVNNLGLRHPDERTKKLCVCIVHLAGNMEVHPESAYDHIRDFSDAMDSARDSIKNIQTMKVFPQDPREFMSIYPTAYGDGQPDDCKIDLNQLRDKFRKEVTPSRSTNNRVKSKPAPSTVDSQIVARQPLMHMGGMEMSLFSILQQFMRGQMNALPPFPQSSSSGSGISPGAEQSQPPQQTPPPIVFSGGVAPQCLQPPQQTPASVHDKLRELKESITKSAGSCKPSPVELTSDDDVSDAPTTLTESAKPKKKAKADPSQKKKPKKNQKNNENEKKKKNLAKQVEPAPKKKSTKKIEKEKLFKSLLKRPAACVRPKLRIDKPTHHHGGAIYWVGAKKCFRVYKRKPEDKASSVVTAADAASKASLKEAFTIACSMIEADPRPVAK